MGCMIDIRELERIEFYDFDSFLPDCFQMLLFERLVVRPVTECIEQCPYLDTLFHFFAEQVEQCIGYGVVTEIEIFQMNVILRSADGFEQVFKFLPPAFDKFHLIVVSDRDVRVLEELHDKGVASNKLCSVLPLHQQAVNILCSGSAYRENGRYY